MSLAEIAAATGGTLVATDGRVLVDGPAVVDSRAVVARSLFVALEGEHVDGHDYAAAAVAAGAAGVLSSRPLDVPSIVVEGGSAGVVEALGRLARRMLSALPDVTVTAVTGSSGKTSTKDLLAQVLPAAGPTVAAEGSYNNDLGVALTVLRADETTRQLALEMGARGRGHIARLCRFAPPEVGIVLNVGVAHVGEFGSRGQIALAKRELVEALPTSGTAVLNIDDPLVAAMAGATSASVLRYGVGRPSRPVDVWADDVRLDDAGRARFELVTPSGRAHVRLLLVGEHHVSNALAAAAAGERAGIALEVVAAALTSAVARSRWRMEVHHRADGVTVINDAYNANPDSVRAALRALVAVGRGGRTWAVLGEMLELGEQAADEHEGIGRYAARLGVSRLVAVGAGARPIHLGASSEGQTGEGSVAVHDRDEAIALLRDELRPGDTVLVKSSRDAGLRALGETLVADVAPTGGGEPW